MRCVCTMLVCICVEFAEICCCVTVSVCVSMLPHLVEVRTLSMLIVLCALVAARSMCLL